jgi:hypothetical protein
MSKKIGEILFLVIVAGFLLLIFSWFVDQRLDDSISDPAWSENTNFATSTPDMDLMAEGGWWDEMATKKPSALPTMPEIDLLEATFTPLPATQTALALTPSITPTRTPLFDVNATEFSTSTPIKDK